MPDYSDVPQRLINGEAVKRTEIIGYNGPGTSVLVDYVLGTLEMLLLVQKHYAEDGVEFSITTFGMQVRQDFLTRIEGDCPECP